MFAAVEQAVRGDTDHITPSVRSRRAGCHLGISREEVAGCLVLMVRTLTQAESETLLRMWVVSSPVLNGLIFKHLHLSWSPPFIVSERIMSTSKIIPIDEVCCCPRMSVSLWGLILSGSVNLRDN